ALAVPEQLLDFLVADPVVLLVVQHRHQDVEMREQVLQAAFRLERHAEVAAASPLGTLLVERVGLRGDRVAERLEELAEEAFAAAAGEDRELRLERERSFSQLGAVAAAAGEGAAVELGDGDAQERGSDVGPVVDVLL